MTGSVYTAFVCGISYGVSDIGWHRVTSGGYSQGYSQ